MKLFNISNKLTLIKSLFGEYHIDSYYEDWVNNKMNTYKEFFNHLDDENKKKYLNLNQLLVENGDEIKANMMEKKLTRLLNEEKKRKKQHEKELFDKLDKILIELGRIK